MKILHKYPHMWAVDYDEEAQEFHEWVKSNFKGKYLSSSMVVRKDDGSYNPKSGKYLEICSDSIGYIGPLDLLKAWEKIV